MASTGCNKERNSRVMKQRELKCPGPALRRTTTSQGKLANRQLKILKLELAAELGDRASQYIRVASGAT